MKKEKMKKEKMKKEKMKKEKIIYTDSEKGNGNRQIFKSTTKESWRCEENQVINMAYVEYLENKVDFVCNHFFEVYFKSKEKEEESNKKIKALQEDISILQQPWGENTQEDISICGNQSIINEGKRNESN